MPNVRFDRFYPYRELTDLLHAFAAEHSRLVGVESIGRSHEGRDIWVLTVTNRDTGDAGEKPAFWVDGNIHSVEVAASVACIYFLKYLIDGYGKDPDVTRPSTSATGCASPSSTSRATSVSCGRWSRARRASISSCS